MPIFDQSFRPYDGPKKLRRFRWINVVAQEFRVLFGNKFFIALMLLPLLHFCLRVLMVITYDMAKYMNRDIASVIAQVGTFTVNEKLFLDFLRIQSPLVLLASILAGAGMICDDFRNNLALVYYAKPLNWLDYALGKCATLLIIGLTLTAAPALFLLLLHNLLVPGLETLKNTYWIAGSIVAFSLLVCLTCALGILALSAISISQRFAGIAAFMLLIGDLVFGQTLAEILRTPNCKVIALPLALNRVGESLFRQEILLFPLSWVYSLLFAMAVCALSLWIVCARARRAEFAR